MLQFVLILANWPTIIGSLSIIHPYVTCCSNVCLKIAELGLCADFLIFETVRSLSLEHFYVRHSWHNEAIPCFDVFDSGPRFLILGTVIIALLDEFVKLLIDELFDVTYEPWTLDHTISSGLIKCAYII